MNRRRRRFLLGFTAAAVAATVTAALVTAHAASADVLDGPPLATNRLSADPHITRCTDPATPDVLGYCMVTSSDRGQANAYPPANYYPMTTTYLLYSPDGVNWVDKGSIARETDIKNPDWVPENAMHQWAPSLNQWGKRYYLYVPNVSNISNGPAEPNIHTSSRIGVWRSPEYNPFGPYEYRGYIVEGEDQYMSDPYVLVDGSDRWLLWADGDFGNCGGLKTAKMTGYMTIDPATIKTVEFVADPIPAPKISDLGYCDPDNGGSIAPIARPYLEGASLYKFDNSKMPGPYTLIFPAKPDDHTPNDTEYGDDVPQECTTANGSDASTNSVIAYATASNPQGPFMYRGIIMCGSTTEWTNQASITEVQAANGRTPWVIVYHDSEADVKERKLYAECLFAGNGKIAGVYRQALDAADGYEYCVEDINFQFSGLHVTDANIGNSGRTEMLSAPNAGNDPVKVNRFAVGPWERFKLFEVDDENNIYVIQSRANNKYLCAALITTALKASCTSSTQFGARFKKEFTGDGTFTLYSVDVNEYLSMHSNDQLYADSDNGSDKAAKFTEMSLL